MPSTSPSRLVAATETLTPNFIAFVRLALGQTLDFRSMQRIELAMIGFLLCEEPRHACQRLGEVRNNAGTFGDLAANIACDAAEKGLQPLDLPSCSPHLPRMRIAVGQAQRSLAQAMITLSQFDAVLGRKPHQDLAAPVIQARVEREGNRLGLHCC